MDAQTMSDDNTRMSPFYRGWLRPPLSSQSYDWVFSNAVIEHVGGPARQQLFASEIRRVARKGYFVATPNRNFPVDPHTLLPLYQFLSPQLQRKVCRFSPGYMKEYEQIDLLSAGDLQFLFQRDVRKMGMRFFPNNLVAYRMSTRCKWKNKMAQPGENFSVLGVGVMPCKSSDVVARMEEWIAQRAMSHDCRHRHARNYGSASRPCI